MENLMDKEELLKLFRSRLARDFILSDYYEGKKYTFVGQSSKEETKSFGLTELTKRIVLVSDYEKMAAEKVKSAIEKLPVLALSGFRSIAKNKTTVLLRVFLMKQIPFELIQQVRMTTSPVTFYIENVKCPVCGRNEPKVPITDIGQTLLFQISQRLNSIEINLKELD